MSDAKLAVQMFTLREHTQSARDLAATLKKVREIGYPAVQMSAIGAMNGDSPEVDAATARQMLDDNGLKCIATHRSWESLAEQTESEIAFHQTLGCDYVAIGSVPPSYEKTVAAYQQFLKDAKPVVERLNAAGLRFGLHNHSFEFYREERHGKTLLDVLIDESPASFTFEFDLYWLEHAGANCVRFVERCAGRIPVIHLKDKEVAEPSNETRMAPIGEGNMDWERILPACEAAGVDWYAVEQDICYRDPFDCLKSSYDFLAARL